MDPLGRPGGQQRLVASRLVLLQNGTLPLLLACRTGFGEVEARLDSVCDVARA